MKIFIAHSDSVAEAKVSADIAIWLRDNGHDARTGDEICSRIIDRRGPWALISIHDELVHDFLVTSDLMIAVCLEAEPRSHNVQFELGYFRRSIRPVSAVIVRGPDAEVPAYLLDGQSKVVEWDGASKTNLFGQLSDRIREYRDVYRKRHRQVFLSYARDDLDAVMPLYNWLTDRGYNIWFDRVKLIIGDQWDRKIVRAIQESVAFIACFSRRSVNKRGYFQRELRRSLEVADEHPEGAIFILPARLDDCEVPSEFSSYHWCDVSAPGAYQNLGNAIEKALDDDYSRQDTQ